MAGLSEMLQIAYEVLVDQNEMIHIADGMQVHG